MSQRYTKIFKAAIIILCCISIGLCGCKDDLFVHPQVENQTTGSKTLFVPPSTDSAVVLSAGDTACSFIYSPHPKAYYKIKNEGKDFTVTVTDKTSTSQKKYASISLVIADSMFLENTVLYRSSVSTYIVRSCTKYTNLIIKSSDFSNHESGYFKIQINEMATRVITENESTTTFYQDNSSSDNEKTRVYIKGTANAQYILQVFSSTDSWILFSSDGSSLFTHYSNMQTQENYPFTFPSDGKNCYIEFKGNIKLRLKRAHEGWSDAITLPVSQIKTTFCFSDIAPGDIYPSKWFKFYGKPGKQYMIRTSKYSHQAISVHDSLRYQLSSYTSYFTMPSSSFVYIKSALSVLQENCIEDSISVYPETTLFTNAIASTVGIPQSFVLTEDDGFTNQSWYYQYVRWFSYSLKANTTYSISASNNNFGLSFFTGMDIAYYNYQFVNSDYQDFYNITPQSDMTLYVKVASNTGGSSVLSVKVSQ